MYSRLDRTQSSSSLYHEMATVTLPSQSFQAGPSSRRNTTEDKQQPDHTHPTGSSSEDAEAQQLSDARWDIPSSRTGVRFVARLKGEHKDYVPGWYESFRNIAFSSRTCG